MSADETDAARRKAITRQFLAELDFPDAAFTADDQPAWVRPLLRAERQPASEPYFPAPSGKRGSDWRARAAKAARKAAKADAKAARKAAKAASKAGRGGTWWDTW